MLGSSLSVSGPNVVLNTAVAEELRRFSEKLKDVPVEEMNAAVHRLIREAILLHKKIIFNGNGYTDEWVGEAEKRGLYNLKTTPDALQQFIVQKNKELFLSHKVFTETEILARYEIILENYSKVIHIESKTLTEMMKKDLLPSVYDYMGQVSVASNEKKSLCPSISTECEVSLITKLTDLAASITAHTVELEAGTVKAEGIEDFLERAHYYCNTVLRLMETIRGAADEAESLIPDDLLPYPTYDQLLFSV